MQTFKLGGLTLGSGGAASYLTESKALFSRSADNLTSDRKKIINDTIKSLVNKGYWQRIDTWQVYAAHSSQFALLNWKGNTINPSLQGSPTFTTDKGFLTSANNYLKTGFNPVQNGVNFKLNDYSWGIYSRTNSQTANRDAGHINGTTGTTLRLRQTTDTLGYLAYRDNATTASGTTGAQTDSRGLFAIDKSANTRVDAYYNGASVANNSIAGANPIDNEMFIGCYNNNGTPSSATNREYCFYYAGDSFTAIEHGEIFAILETYLNAIGAGFFLT